MTLPLLPRALLQTLLFSAVLLAPLLAGATELRLLDSPLRLEFNEYGTFAYHADNGSIAPVGSLSYDPTGSDYYDWINRIQADASWRQFTFLLRFDSAFFLHAPVAAPGDKRFANLLQDRYGDRVDLEKIAVGYTSRHLELTLGDSYVTYGRGLVLAMRKYDELGVDTTLRGISATGHVEGLNVNGLAGLSNIVNVDTATGREADDPRDKILGARAEYRFGTWVVPGVDVAHFIYNQNRSASTDRDHLTACSATLELPSLGGFGTAYFEYARQQRHILGADADASAFYAAGTAYLGPATLLLEFKNYVRFDPIPTSLDPIAVPELALTDFYDAPPTLERVQQAVLNNADVVGPHARLEWAVTPSVAPFISMAGFDDHRYHVRIYDPYGGVEVKWDELRSRLSLSGGIRTSHFNEGRQAGNLFENEWHVEYDVNEALQGPYSVELDGLHMSHRDLVGPKFIDWIEGQSYLSLKRAETWSLAAGYEYYTEFPTAVRPGYVNLSSAVNLGRSVLLRLFVGGQRAGIKCVNGVCRNYPAFEGARAELLAKF